MGSPVDRVEWLPVKNIHTETIPPGGLMKPVEIDTATRALKVTKPDSDGQMVLVNNVVHIGPGGLGEGTFDNRVAVAYLSSDGTPANGEAWGAASGQWKARKGKGGFTILGGAADGYVNAVRAALSSDWFFARIDSGSADGPYAFTKVALTSPGLWTEPLGAFSGTGYRAPSAASGVGYPPSFPVNQVVLARLAADYAPGMGDPATLYELTPWGGIQGPFTFVTAVDLEACTVTTKQYYLRDAYEVP